MLNVNKNHKLLDKLFLNFFGIKNKYNSIISNKIPTEPVLGVLGRGNARGERNEGITRLQQGGVEGRLVVVGGLWRKNVAHHFRLVALQSRVGRCKFKILYLKQFKATIKFIFQVFSIPLFIYNVLLKEGKHKFC